MHAPEGESPRAPSGGDDPRHPIWPRAFIDARSSHVTTDPYLGETSIRQLLEFFEAKGLRRLKDEDAREQWYADWIEYQTKHRIYASVLSPKQQSSLGAEFDLLRYARLLEVFAYCSPAHGYSLQCTFLGLFSILMGTNDVMKKEAVAALEAGGLMAFAVSEKDHGSDLMANEFTVTEVQPRRYVAGGKKYYIGNANAAAMISILARKVELNVSARGKRMPLVMCALRPKQSPGYGNVEKIRTFGIRAGFVGAFEVKDHPLPESDVIAEGRDAWDALFGTITLGKFFLGFGSIGICEHALAESIEHMGRRILFGKPVLEMPHIRSAVATAYARLTAMKLYAYRALDYVRAASAEDRRYLLYCAVQKARVSTEGVKVMSLLSECVNAKGFEAADTYFEMALRDVQLIPGLESSTHVNLALASQFIPRYFGDADPACTAPASLVGGDAPPGENPYLFVARTGAINTIAFADCLGAYEALASVRNVRLFARQTRALRLFARKRMIQRNASDAKDVETSLYYGRLIAMIAYGQLVAENAARLGVPHPVISVVFGLLVEDLSAAAMAIAASPKFRTVDRVLLRRLVVVPRTTQADWDFVAARASSMSAGKSESRPTA